MSSQKAISTSIRSIKERIYLFRGLRVILDRDLADLYGVTTYRLNEQIKRNQARFPRDFMFQLNEEETTCLRSQFAISKGRGGRRYRPYAFTEHGAVMVATVLNSPIAIEASILIVRAFIRLREMVLENADFKRRLESVESKLAKGFARKLSFTIWKVGNFQRFRINHAIKEMYSHPVTVISHVAMNAHPFKLYKRFGKARLIGIRQSLGSTNISVYFVRSRFGDIRIEDPFNYGRSIEKNPTNVIHLLSNFLPANGLSVPEGRQCSTSNYLSSLHSCSSHN